jgi:hypothetical protein
MAEHQLSALTMRTEFFAAEQMEAAARRTGVVTRASNMTGQLLLAGVTGGAWSDATTTFAQRAAQVTPVDTHVHVSPEAISQRRHQRAHACLPERIQPALATPQVLAAGCEEGFCAAFPKVSRADRTGFARPDRLNATGPGSGGRAAPAGATMQAVWDDTSRRLAPWALTAWHRPDQTSGDNGVAGAPKGA